MKRILFAGCLCAALQAAKASPVEPRDTTKVVDVEEVVVVASPKENLKFRQQALSSSVFSREQLEEVQVTSLKNLTALVPNFYMPDYGSRLTSAIYIRGVGSRINTPAIGLYVDNVPYLDKSAFDFNTYDIERIDVLRGPQSTLYGRNAMGGLVRIYTRNPFRHQGTEFSVGASTANNSYRSSLTHYHRLNSRFAFSASGFYEGARGFFKNITSNKYADPLQSGGGRLRAIWLPSENWKMDFTANYEYSDEGGYAYGLYHTDTNETDPVSSNRKSKYRRGLFNTGLSATYSGKCFVFNTITSYQRLNDRMFMDQDFTALDKYTLEQKQRLNAWTEEISFKNLPGKQWQWITGAFASYQNLSTNSPVHFYADGVQMIEDEINGYMPQSMKMGIDFTSQELPIYSDFKTPVTSLAIFHQSTLNNLLVEGLSLTVGLRLDHERISMDYYSDAAIPFEYNMSMLPQPLTFEAKSLLQGKIKNHYAQLLPKFSLKYDFDSQNNVYATVSKGYRSGGYNIQMFSELSKNSLQGSMTGQVKDRCIQVIDGLVAAGRLPEAVANIAKKGIQSALPNMQAPDIASTYYKPEYTWSYELGTHLTLLDDKLQADVAGFLMDTHDQQISRMTDSGLGRKMVNAGRSRSYGAEASLTASINRHLNLNASYGYTRAFFKNYDGGTDKDYSGNTVPFVPRHTVSAGASYTFYMKGDFLKQMVLHANYTGNGSSFWDEANTSKQKYYGLYNAGITFRTKVCDVNLWGHNLSGIHYHSFQVESMGNWFAQKGKPRQFGIDLRFHI